jgi:hypothetical protein
MDLDSSHAVATMRDGYLDSGFTPPKAPEVGRAAVTQGRTGAAGECGGEIPAMAGNSGVPDRIYPTVQRVEPACLFPAVNG